MSVERVGGADGASVKKLLLQQQTTSFLLLSVMIFRPSEMLLLCTEAGFSGGMSVSWADLSTQQDLPAQCQTTFGHVYVWCDTGSLSLSDLDPLAEIVLNKAVAHVCHTKLLMREMFECHRSEAGQRYNMTAVETEICGIVKYIRLNRANLRSISTHLSSATSGICNALQNTSGHRTGVTALFYTFVPFQTS